MNDQGFTVRTLAFRDDPDVVSDSIIHQTPEDHVSRLVVALKGESFHPPLEPDDQVRRPPIVDVLISEIGIALRC